MRPDRFFLRVWRWHFYAGLFVLPVLFTLALTGAVTLFKDEIEGIYYKDFVFNPTNPVADKPATQSLPLEFQLNAAKSALPNGTLKKMIPPVGGDRSTQFVFETPESEEKTVFVNPNQATVLGTRTDSTRLSSIALKIHSELFAGKWGELLIETLTCWTILLIVTGVYLSFPRGKTSKFWGVVLPRLRSTSKRILWRDIHSVSGFWVAAMLLFFCITGLFWTGVWGEKIVKPWNTFPVEKYQQIPKSTLTNSNLNLKNSKSIPWAQENLPIPESSAHSGHKLSDPNKHKSTNNLFVSIDDIAKTAKNLGFNSEIEISLPLSPTGVFTVTSVAPNATDEHLVHIDAYSGEPLVQVTYNDYSILAKSVATSIALHEGRMFGFANKIVNLIGCILTMILCMSAAVLVWKRRPTLHSSIAPSRVQLPKLWKQAAILVGVFCLLFPLAGASLAIVLILDSLILSKLKAFGAS